MKNVSFIISIFILLFALACSTARREETVVKPLGELSAALAEGEHEFMEYCSKCHPGGGAGLGPAINNKPLPGGMIKFQVRNGLGVMPAFSKDVISEEELDKMVKYLVAIRKNKDKREAYQEATAGN